MAGSNPLSRRDRGDRQIRSAAGTVFPGGHGTRWWQRESNRRIRDRWDRTHLVSRAAVNPLLRVAVNWRPNSVRMRVPANDG